MYKIILPFYFCCLLTACQFTTSSAPKSKEISQLSANSTDKALRHVVLFKFKDGTPTDTIKAIEQAFAGLKQQIPTILDFEWGPNNSPEKLDQGYTHCFVVTFASESDRDAYLPNPAHQSFVEKWAKPYVDKVCVFDFWAN
jgi:Stress responsive A/B Barrel Domain